MSSLFVGRAFELQQLQNLYTKKNASLVVLRGRRRIGKGRVIILQDESLEDTQFFPYVIDFTEFAKG